MATVGFVGLGVMGSRMVKRLMDAGHTVVGHNRTKSKADWLIDAGMQWADTPRAVAEQVNVVIAMVADTEAVRAVAEGPDGIIAGLGAGDVYVDMSTVSPEAIRELAAKVEERGAKMLDAPVSGSVSTLEEGKLSIMVGGDPETLEQVKPILLDIGPTITHVGENGQALAVKIAINLTAPVQMLAFCEAVLLAEKSGISRKTAAEAIFTSVMASPMVKYRGPFVLEMPDESWFNVNMMQKDLTLAMEMGKNLAVPLPTAAVTNEMLTAARGMGLAEKDFAVIFDVLAQMAGVESNE